MKKITFLMMLFALLAGTVSAQDQIFVAKLKKEEVPGMVVTSIEKDFPGGTVSEYKAIPMEIVGEEWVFSEKARVGDYDTYIVNIEGKGLEGEATYDRNGNLIAFTEHKKNFPLPHAIQYALGEMYPGWAVENDHEIITYHHPEGKKVYYRIKLMKGKEKMKVVLDGNGNEIKEHMNRKIG